MNGLPFYKAYPIDFLSGTAGMKFEEKSAYRLVLDLIYMHGGELPDDAGYISGQLGCSVRKWNSLRGRLLTLKTRAGKNILDVENGLISNFRARAELESTRKYQASQSEKGSKHKKINKLQKPLLNHSDSDSDKKEEDSPPLSPSLGGIDLATNQEPPTDDKPKRGSRLPADWRPDEKDCEFARGLGLDPGAIAGEFRDYWHDVPGAKGVKLDWRGTWRNKCRSVSRTFGGGNSKRSTGAAGNKHGPASFAQAARNVLERIERAADSSGDIGPTEGFAGFDDAASGGRGGNGNSSGGLRAKAVGIPGGHSSPCLDGTTEEIEVVPGVVRIGGRT